MRQTDLIQVDTFRMDGGKGGRTDEAEAQAHLHMNRKWRSALEIIVAHEKQEFTQNELFNKLIMSKWTKFGRQMYLTRTVIPYLFLLTIFASVVVLRGDEIQRDFDGGSVAVVPIYCLTDRAHGILYSGNAASDPVFMVTLVFEGSVVVLGAPWLLWKGWRQRRLKMRDLDLNEDGVFSAEEIQIFVYKNLHFLLNLSSAAFILAAGASRIRCRDQDEANCLAVASVLLFCNLLNVMMPFRSIGGLVITIYRMFINGIYSEFLHLEKPFLFPNQQSLRAERGSLSPLV